MLPAKPSNDICVSVCVYSVSGAAAAVPVGSSVLLSTRPDLYHSRPAMSTPPHADCYSKARLIGRYHYMPSNMTSGNDRVQPRVTRPAVTRYRPYYYCNHAYVR